MGEYGRIVGEGSGVGSRGGGGGSGDVTGQVMSAVSDAIDQVAALPTEVLVLIAAFALIAGMLFFRR